MKIESNQICLRNEEPKVGNLYDYYEDGLTCEVKILEKSNDEKGFGFKLEITQSPSRMYVVGETFDCWAAHGRYAYNGMWRLYPRGEYYWTWRNLE